MFQRILAIVAATFLFAACETASEVGGDSASTSSTSAASSAPSASSADDDFFCTICNFVLTAVIFLCAILKQSVLSEAVADTLSADFRKLFVFDAGFVSLMLVCMIIGCAIVALLFTVYQLAVAARVPQFRVRATRRSPTLNLHQGKLWHLFLSHI